MANKPNNPSLWSKAKSLAKQKFDVYPSAYANGWAAKWYKSKGGTWRKAQFGMEISNKDISIPALPVYAQGGEPDGGMALQQMNAVIDKLSNLRKFIKPDTDLEPWISSKLAVMDHYADAVSDYMNYGQEYQTGGDVPDEYSPNLPQMQQGGQCPEGFFYFEPAGECIPISMTGDVTPTRGFTTGGINLTYPKFNLGYNYEASPFGRTTHSMNFGLPQTFNKRGSLNISGRYTPKQSWAANLESEFKFGKRNKERTPRLTLNASVDKFFGDPELSEMSRIERLLPPQKTLNYNIEAGLNIPLRKQGNLRISGSYGKQAMKHGGWLDVYKK